MGKREWAIIEFDISFGWLSDIATAPREPVLGREAGEF